MISLDRAVALLALRPTVRVRLDPRAHGAEPVTDTL
jgi:hypothetical protein